MITAAVLAVGLSVPGLPGDGTPQERKEVRLALECPYLYIKGEPFVVTIRAEAPLGGLSSLPVWALTPAAFDLDGDSLGQRDADVFLEFTPGQRLETTIDLGDAIQENPNFQPREFRLTYVAAKELPPNQVYYARRAERGIHFMELPTPQLSEYDVVLLTMHGPIWIQLWPDVAPNHVRNFLDLAYDGFYDDNHFHRVIPGFMIQGGGASAERPAPRRVKNEFNDRRHMPGVVSMARLPVDTPDEEGNRIPAFDSATCEFFVVHQVSPHLDGKYTAFGKVVQGMDAVEKVVESVEGSFNPRITSTHEPKTRQTIMKAIVVKAPDRRPGEEDE